MLRRVLRSKIHKAHVTHADINYEGSITLSPELLSIAQIMPYEAVELWNVTNGNRCQTYAIEGQQGSYDISVNGAAAHLFRPKDIIIIACFGYLSTNDLIVHKPKVIFLDENNKIREIGQELAGPLSR